MYPCGSSSSPETNIHTVHTTPITSGNPSPLVLPSFKSAFLGSNVLPRRHPSPLPRLLDQPLLQHPQWALGNDLTETVHLLENRIEPIKVIHLLSHFPDTSSSSSVQEPESDTLLHSSEHSRNDSTQEFLEKLFEKTPLENPSFTTLLTQDLNDNSFQDIPTDTNLSNNLISTQEEGFESGTYKLVQQLTDERTEALCNFDDANWSAHLFDSIDVLENELIQKFGKSNRAQNEAQKKWRDFYDARNHAIVMYLKFSLQKNPQLKMKDFTAQLGQVYKKKLTQETLLHIRKKLCQKQIEFRISYTADKQQAVVWHCFLLNKTPYQYCSQYPFIKVTTLTRWVGKHGPEVKRIIAEQEVEKIAPFKTFLQKQPFQLVFPEVPAPR